MRKKSGFLIFRFHSWIKISQIFYVINRWKQKTFLFKKAAVSCVIQKVTTILKTTDLWLNFKFTPVIDSTLILHSTFGVANRNSIAICIFLLCWCFALSYSAGPSKPDLTSSNCMTMKPYHSVQISIPLLGEILFQAITLHQRDVIPTLCCYCPLWPVSSAVPLRQKHTWCTSCWTHVM